MKQQWDAQAIARTQSAAARAGKPVPKHVRLAQSELAKRKNRLGY